MSRKLWDYYSGEPFMENPHLVVIGPNPKKKGKRKMARKVRGRKNARRRRRARRNPFPVAGLAVNPRRRRRTYHMKRNRRGVYSHRHRGGRRNPAVLGVALPPINMIAWGAAGFIAPPMVESFVAKFLPVTFTGNTLGRYVLKIGSVLGLTYLTKHVLGNKEAFPVALGGSLYVVVSAANEFMPQLFGTAPPPPVTGVQAYRSGMIKAYRGGMISTGIGQYSQPGLARSLPGLANIVSPGDNDSRFNRF